MKTLHFIIMIILFPVVALSQNLEKIGGKGEAQRNNKNEIGFFKATANVEAITNKNDFFSSVLNIAKTDEYQAPPDITQYCSGWLVSICNRHLLIADL